MPDHFLLLHFLLVTKQSNFYRLDQTIGKPYYHGNAKDRQRSTLCARIAHIEQQVGLHYIKLLNIGNLSPNKFCLFCFFL